MRIPPKTLFMKSLLEGLRFVGMNGNTVFDSVYWRNNYRYFENLTNPFDTFQFMQNGRLVETSLAELCLFQQDTFNSAINEIRRIISDLSSGETAIITNDFYSGEVRSIESPNFRQMDERWNSPEKWFSFPHTTDVYSPSLSVFPGVPVPKTDSFNGWRPTANLLNSSRFSDDSYWSVIDRITNVLNSICIASNLNPNLLSPLFTVNSPGPNLNDYSAMDGIARNVANTYYDRFADAHSDSMGVPIGEFRDNPRLFWAGTPDGDARDITQYVNYCSERTGIPLDGSVSTNFMAYYCDFAFPVIHSDPSGNAGLVRPSNEYLLAFMYSLRLRSPVARNLVGIRYYADSVGAMLQLLNLLEFLKNAQPQLILHSGMSFDNALKSMSFNQLGGAIGTPGWFTESDYQRLWNQEVNMRNSLPPGQGGFSVPLQPDITIQNIGTAGLAAGGVIARSGNAQIGAVIMAASALLTLCNSPQYGEILARAPDIEFIRQNGQHNLNSTIYRKFTPRKILNTMPVMRTT